MEKGDIIILAQLFSALKDAIDRLDIAFKKKSMEDLAIVKNEIMELQSKIDMML